MTLIRIKAHPKQTVLVAYRIAFENVEATRNERAKGLSAIQYDM